MGGCESRAARVRSAAQLVQASSSNDIRQLCVVKELCSILHARRVHGNEGEIASRVSLAHPPSSPSSSSASGAAGPLPLSREFSLSPARGGWRGEQGEGEGEGEERLGEGAGGAPPHSSMEQQCSSAAGGVSSQAKSSRQRHTQVRRPPAATTCRSRLHFDRQAAAAAAHRCKKVQGAFFPCDLPTCRLLLLRLLPLPRLLHACTKHVIVVLCLVQQRSPVPVVSGSTLQS